MPDATIYDVAKRAQVSISTVSRVLNTPDLVQHETRIRVLQAIDDLGFVPRADAAARARKGTRRIGVLAPFLVYPSFIQRLRGVTTLANSAYELVMYNVESSSQRDGYLSSLSVTRRLDGLIVMALPFDDIAAQRLISNDLETVVIEWNHPLFNSVEIDDYAGGKMVSSFLLSRGHKRLAFIGDSVIPDYALPTSQQRLAGFKAVLDASGLPLQGNYVALGPHGLEAARQLTFQLLDLPERPTAIFASSDMQALGALRAISERNLRTPEDVAVVGFDDIEVADYMGLTTVRQPLEDSGKIAVELLLSRLADRSRPIQHVKLPLQLIERQTA